MRRLTQGSAESTLGFYSSPERLWSLSNTLLVSNNINSGTIDSFNIATGDFVGTIKDVNGKAIHFDQLWGIEFGGGTGINGGKNELFFTAGPVNNLAGTFGVITFK
jgi:hypothetical protein